MKSVIYKPNHRSRLSIIDPNNPSNDIAGGSFNYPSISMLFAKAYRQLHGALSADAASTGAPPRQSLLGCVFAGNYSSFSLQRAYMRRLHEEVWGPCDE